MVRADAAVISTDSLIYGGLVDSRKHNESLTVLMGRENKIKSLHSQYPKTPIYAFGTIMRTPMLPAAGWNPITTASMVMICTACPGCRIKWMQENFLPMKQQNCFH